MLANDGRNPFSVWQKLLISSSRSLSAEKDEEIRAQGFVLLAQVYWLVPISQIP
jgi:hypothetical protein